MTQGQETGNIVVPSLADRAGNLSDLASQLTGNVSSSYLGGPAFAEAGLQRHCRRAVLRRGLRQFLAVCLSQCADSRFAVVGAREDLAAIHSHAQRRRNTFSTSSQNETLSDNKAGVAHRPEHAPWGNLSAYYFFDQYT